jgi:hypothetical protein
MAVTYSIHEVMSLEQFGLDYLIPLHSKRAHLQEVSEKAILLDPRLGRRVVHMFEPFPSYPFPFDSGRFHVTSDISFRSTEEPEERSRVEGWLLSLPIPGDELVYLVRKTAAWRIEGCPVVAVPWEPFARDLWHILWGPNDYMALVDDSADWAVIIGPEPFAIFAERGAVNPGLPENDPAYGFGLLRVRE